jgi:hypothetical protein
MICRELSSLSWPFSDGLSASSRGERFHGMDEVKPVDLGGTHMIKKSILSVFGGVVFAALLSCGVPAKAGCLGLCPDRIGNYVFVGCALAITYPGGVMTIEDFRCYYEDTTGDLPVDPNIAE